MDRSETETQLVSPAAVESETALNRLPNSPASEGELRRRLDELQDFVDRVAVPLQWVAEDGTILWANDAGLGLLGYLREEYVGHNIVEFHVDESVILDILRRLKNNEELRDYESRLRCKDGSIRDVAINSSVYREDGRFIHTRCVTQDVSAQKKASELQDRMTAIVDSSGDDLEAQGCRTLGSQSQDARIECRAQCVNIVNH